MSEVKVNQHVSKGVTGTVDNMALQAIIKLVEESKLKNEQMLSFTLGSCPHCQKQYISMCNVETTPEGEVEEMQCVFCEKPVDAKVIVYQFDGNGSGTEISGIIQVICLEEEAEDLVKKYEAKD